VAHNLLRAQPSQQGSARRHSRASIGTMSDAILRPATELDCEAVAAVWHAAWHDAHDEQVPARLVDDRQRAYFAGRVPSLIERTSVAEDAAGVVGFVTVTGDELDLLFVDARGRGTGVAAALLSHGEQMLAAEYDTGWLEVVTGNARARAFYARQGWRDTGPADRTIDTSRGPALVPSHRYEKWLRG
jgi:GNAT superfamily N-acetyltransferase